MTIQEKNKVDLVGEDPNGSSVRLVILDDLNWSEFCVHKQALQDKVNAYLEFVESGQIAEAAPSAGCGAKIEFQLVMRYRPTTQGQDFVDRVGQFLRQHGYLFSVELRES